MENEPQTPVQHLNQQLNPSVSTTHKKDLQLNPYRVSVVINKSF